VVEVPVPVKALQVALTQPTTKKNINIGKFWLTPIPPVVLCELALADHPEAKEQVIST
jgi:hypothetical protein